MILIHALARYTPDDIYRALQIVYLRPGQLGPCAQYHFKSLHSQAFKNGWLVQSEAWDVKAG